MPVSLVKAFKFVLVFKFSLGVLALLKLMLTVNVIISSTVIMMRGIRHVVRRRGLSPCRTAGGTVRKLAKTVVTASLMLTTMFIPMDFLNKVAKRLCHRFAMAVMMSMLLSAMMTLALDPIVYSLVLGPRSPGGGGGVMFHHVGR